jgi:hypothetical protein
MPRVPAYIALLALLAACSGDPETVLQSDLPQVPGMTPRDTIGLRQDGGRVVGGQFAYTGSIPGLSSRIAETMARFEGLGWKLRSETLTGATAVLVYAKDDRTATVQIVRNGLQPLMSTAVMRVDQAKAVPQSSDAPEAPAAPVSG